MKDFNAEVGRIRELYNKGWEANWGNVPMTDAEFAHMAKQLKPVAVPEMVLFAYVRGTLAGFALALPDLNVALRHMNGRLLPIGWALGLWHGRHIDRGRVLTLGVLPEFLLHRRGGPALPDADQERAREGVPAWRSILDPRGQPADADGDRASGRRGVQDVSSVRPADRGTDHALTRARPCLMPHRRERS